MRYSLLVPTPWERIDLKDVDVAQQTAHLVKRYVMAAPLASQPQVRQTLQEHLTPVLTRFVEAGVDCAVMQVNPYASAGLQPVLTLKRIELPFTEQLPEGTDLRVLLAGMAEEMPEADIVEYGELLAVRSRQDTDVSQQMVETADQMLPDRTPEGPGQEIRAVGVKVQHIIGHPDDPARWVLADFAVDAPDTPEGLATADAVVELFDAIVASLRWES